MTDEEYPLKGGNSTDSAVRVGSTIRKPWLDTTASVLEYVAALAAKGVDVPEALGRDEKGRQVAEFIPDAWRWRHRLSPPQNSHALAA